MIQIFFFSGLKMHEKGAQFLSSINRSLSVAKCCQVLLLKSFCLEWGTQIQENRNQLLSHWVFHLHSEYEFLIVLCTFSMHVLWACSICQIHAGQDTYLWPCHLCVVPTDVCLIKKCLESKHWLLSCLSVTWWGCKGAGEGNRGKGSSPDSL